jgi:DNA-binding protein HU-beta
VSANTKIALPAFTGLVARRAKVSGVQADAYIHQLAKTMAEGLEKGSDIPLHRFGRFHTTHVAEKMGHNPNSGKRLKIPEHTRVHFRPYGALRFAVNAPFRQLRIKELNEDKTAWRVRPSGLMLLALLAVLLILLGIGLKSWLYPQNATVVPAEKAAAIVEQARPVEEAPVTATETTAPAKPLSTTASVVTVVPGDTLWGISATVWGNSLWWPIIYVVNRSAFSSPNPDLIDIGMKLQIPALSGSVNNPVAADLQLKTDAYKIVAEDYQKLDSPRAAAYATAAERGFGK